MQHINTHYIIIKTIWMSNDLRKIRLQINRFTVEM